MQAISYVPRSVLRIIIEEYYTPISLIKKLEHKINQVLFPTLKVQ